MFVHFVSIREEKKLQTEIVDEWMKRVEERDKLIFLPQSIIIIDGECAEE